MWILFQLPELFLQPVRDIFPHQTQYLVYMIQHRPTHPKLLFLFISLFVFFTVVDVKAQDGKALFSAKCASCHSVTKDLTGPALQGVTDRGPWSDKKKLHEWVHNPASFMANDPYTQALKTKYGV